MCHSVVDPFSDKHKFIDDVWGQVRLSDLERDVIDTPEFQRLFRTSQLGFVDLVYQTANHTRGAHSIGACAVAQKLLRRLEANLSRLPEEARPPIRLSQADRVLIRLAALLHDISHVPLSHDIEKKSHKIPVKRDAAGRWEYAKMKSCHGRYDKHDDCEINPLLYIQFFDKSRSVLARVLAAYSRKFYRLLIGESELVDGTRPLYPHLRRFGKFLRGVEQLQGDDEKIEELILPQLLFHLLLYEKQDEAEEAVREIAIDFRPTPTSAPKTALWGLGVRPRERPRRNRRRDTTRKTLHRLWYQPFRHDIVGNPLCADLLDYLKRDPERMGMSNRLDLTLLNYYVLKPTVRARMGSPERYSCAIDLYDHKRGTVRLELLNDIFRLLDLRHEIHEKAVMHRVVQSANAMLARALLLLGENVPSLAKVVGIGDSRHALHGEDYFFAELLRDVEAVKEKLNLTTNNTDRLRNIGRAVRILEKLSERRVYRPLMMLSGNQADEHICGRCGPDDPEQRLRTLATVVDSQRYFSFLLFASALVQLFLEGVIGDRLALMPKLEQAAHNADLSLPRRTPPARVILWTTPYKQLYKDPALVVSVGGDAHQCPIDQLPQHDLPGSGAAVKRRAVELLQDADGRYAAIWKLCVFLSDSLFYTGVFGKLLEYASSDKARDKRVTRHERRLSDGAVLMLTAVRVAYRDWVIKSAPGKDRKSQEDLLSAELDDDAVRELIKAWYHEASLWWHEHTAEQIRSLTVHMAPYVHSDGEEHGGYDPKCRDIRSKFDQSATFAAESTTGLAGVLNRLKIPAADLADAEFRELERRFQKNGQACEELLRLRGEITAAYLQVLWADELSLLGTPPADDLGAVEGSVEVPETDEGLSERLHVAFDSLTAREMRHVRTKLKQEVPEIVAFIQNRPAQRQQIFRDLVASINNTSELMAANLKQISAVETLSKRWRS